MYSALTATALDDFLTLAAPFARRLIDPPKETTEADERIREEMREICRTALVTGNGGWPVDALFRLRKILETAIHLGKASDSEWQLLWEVFEALADRGRCLPLSDKVAWKTGLDAALCALNHSSFRHSMIGGSREEVVARAFAALKRKGYPYIIDGSGARLTPPSFRKLCARIEDKIERVGGLHMANAMLALMQQIGRVEDGSLLHARTPTTVRLEGPKARTPWHYIYNLALKHFNSVPRARNSEMVLQVMEDLARDLAASIDVEPHCSYENMRISESGLSGIIHETTSYDELFGFPQWQPLASNTLIPLWLDVLKDVGCQFPTLTCEEWKSVASSFITRSRPSSIESISTEDLVSQTVSQNGARSDEPGHNPTQQELSHADGHGAPDEFMVSSRSNRKRQPFRPAPFPDDPSLL
jgi:hypothetical protein